MHSVLFVAFIPQEPSDDWGRFVSNVQSKIRQDKNALRLAENVWLLNLQGSVAPLGWLVAAAETTKVPYGLIPFQNAPEWLPAGFDPKTIPARNAI